MALNPVLTVDGVYPGSCHGSSLVGASFKTAQSPRRRRAARWCLAGLFSPKVWAAVEDEVGVFETRMRIDHDGNVRLRIVNLTIHFWSASLVHFMGNWLRYSLDRRIAAWIAKENYGRKHVARLGFLFLRWATGGNICPDMQTR